MANDLIIAQRGSDTAPALSGYDEITNPLHPSQRTSNRFSHFTDGVYDLSPESHLSRFLKVLLGDVGVGQLHKRLLLTRLQSILGGTHFFDLDAFYGNVFGVHRRAAEQLLLDPFRQNVTQSQWDQLRVRDGSYRSRAEQFARAINLGATVGGLEQAAEAVLNVDCEIREGWTVEDAQTRNWANVEALGTYGTIEGSQTWLSLEQQGTTRALGRTRHVITVIPKRPLTPEERYDVTRILERMKPAGSIVEVIAAPPDVFIPAAIQVAASDSTHWEIHTQIGNTPIEGQYLYRGDTTQGYIDSPTTPWGNYQGEAWTLLSLNPATVATTIPDGNIRDDMQFSPSAQDLPAESYKLATGDAVTFSSRYALRSPQALYSGRLLSDGVLSSNPYSGTRDQYATATQMEGGAFTNIGFSTTADVNVDGADLDAISSVSLLKDSINRQSLLFWTTPIRPWDSDSVDVLEVRFNTPQTFNLLSVEISHYPADFEVQAWDSTAGIWRKIISQTVRDSVPFSVNGALPPGAIHPYHFGENHWIPLKERIPTTTAAIVRFVFKRGVTGLPPFGVDGKATQYPLALRNIDIGYRVTSIDGTIPSNDPSAPLISSVNAVGQPTRHFITTYPASNILGTGETFWKSQPQPVGNAVVNLYLDMRVGSGTVPVVDRFFLDPLTSGPSFNLYYSPGSPTLDLGMSLPQDTDLFPSNIQGNIRAFVGGDGGLFWANGTVGFLDFDNADLQFSPTQQSWWVGASLVAQSPSNLMSRSAVLSFGTAASVGDVAITFDADVLKLTWLAQTVTVPAVFATGDRVDIVASFRPQTNGTVILNAYVSVDHGATATATATYSGGSTVARPSTIRIGHTASNDSAADVFPFRLLGLNVHYGDGTAQATTFMADPSQYRQVPNPDDRTLAVALGNPLYDHTLGALVRFDPGFIRAGVSMGFIGGQPDIYGSLEWQPIARDYTLRKGYIKIPPTAGAIWKFEFTGLTPEPYETFLAIPRTVKLFSPQAAAPASNGVSWDNETLTALSMASIGRYDDMPAFTTYVPLYSNTTPPTLAISSLDPQGSAMLRDRRGFPYNTVQWQPPASVPQYVRKGVHTYNISQVDHINKVGFFVGLRQLAAYRADYGVPENTTTYIDNFWDLANMTPGMTMVFDTNRLYTPNAGFASIMGSPRTATSRVFPSYVPVEAVQFATWQSAPVSVIYDENFKDPTLPTSPFTDTGGWHFTGDAHVIYDGINKAVKVSRNPDLIRTVVGSNNPVVHPPITPVFTTTPVWSTTFNSAAQGGLASTQVPVSAGGALHAAIRVVIPKTLTSPLWLQIVGSDGTTVLTETSFTPTPGVYFEQTLNYLLGQRPSLEASVEMRVVQKGGSADEWSVYSFALFDDSILWEWSNDGGTTWHPAVNIRNNESGVLRFSQIGCGLRYRVTCYRNNTAITMVKIKPWYQGRVLGRHALPQRGPNLSVFDDDIPIQEDPDFTSWTDPVPQAWYARYKSLTIETTSQYGDSLFAHTLSRTSSDAAPVVDTAHAIVTYVRRAGESVAVSDAAVQHGTYSRSATDPAHVSDSGHKVTWETVARPPVDPPI